MTGLEVRSKQRSADELTRAVFGETLSFSKVLDLVESAPSVSARAGAAAEETWVGSIGYERFSSNADFASALREANVEILVDVRDLPISRKRGFAKTALAEAVGELGIDYLHMKGLGNPKPIRDRYKAGDVDGGRAMYEDLLRKERSEYLVQLAEIIRDSRVALMCVEHNEDACHRQSILRALEGQMGPLQIGHLPET